MEDIRIKLPLDLQFFAEKEEEVDTVDEEEYVKGTEDSQEGAQDVPEDTEDKDLDVDELVEQKLQERLKQLEEKQREEQEKREEEQRRKKLEEEGKHEEVIRELEEKLARAERERVATLKSSLLVSEGYSAEQAEALAAIVEGEDEETMKESIAKVSELFPATKKRGVDPSLGNSRSTGKGTGKPKGEELGRSLFEKITGKKK